MPRPPEALGTPQDFGDNAGQSVDQIPDVQDRLDRAAAEQDFISNKLDLDQQFAGDTDYATVPQRYRQALLQGLNDTSQGIAAPAQRADFQQQMSGVAAGGVDSIFRQSVAKARDAGRASVTQAGVVAVNDALRATNEADLNPIFNAFNGRVQASLEAGYLSPEEAVALRKRTAQSYVSQRGWRLTDADPQQAVDMLSPTETSADGQPSFAKTGDWRDFLDLGERASMVQRAQQNLQAQQRAAEVDTLRRQRQQQKADTDAQAIAVGKDVGVGLTELPKQMAGGVVDFGNNLMKFADDAVKRAEEAGLPNIYFQLFDKDGNWAPRMLSTEEFRAEQAAGTNGIFQVPTTGSAESVTGNIIRTGTTFLLGRGGLAKGGGVLANVGASGVSGALMDPREPRLSNLIDSIAPNFITDWLKARPDQEPGLLDRLKGAAEYAGLDLGFAGVTRVLRSVKEAVTDAGARRAAARGNGGGGGPGRSGRALVTRRRSRSGPATLSPFQDTEG